MTTAPTTTPLPRRRWLQFSLRTLMVLVLVVSVPLGWVAMKVRKTRQQRLAAEALKKFKGSYTWPADWNDIFSKIYKKDFNSLPKGIATLFGSTFGPETFSVLSYGTVGQITHRLFAIVERDTTDREDKEPAKVLIKKLYWI